MRKAPRKALFAWRGYNFPLLNTRHTLRQCTTVIWKSIPWWSNLSLSSHSGPNGERVLMDLDFDKYKAQQFCDNLDCSCYGKTDSDNIRTHSRLHHQVYCNACKQIWVITKGTFFYRLKAPVSLILEVLKLLSEGMGLRAVCRSKSVTPDAVSAWVQKAAKHVREVTVCLERDMHLTQCQIDEFWSYILKKSEPERRRIGSRGLGG